MGIKRGRYPRKRKKMTKRYEEEETIRPTVEFITASMYLDDIKTADEAVEYFHEWWKNPAMHRAGEALDVDGITDDDIRQSFEWTLEQAKKTGKVPCLNDGEVIW